MARWALKAKHYLTVEDCEYEYTETERSTGKARKLKFKVPRFLDPDDPNDINYPPDVIVCYSGKGLPRDIVFFGEPTPDMEPLDEEAVAISKKLEPKWINPMGEQALPATGSYSDAMLANFERALNDMINRIGIPKAVPNVAVPDDILAKLQAQMEELVRKNAELEARLNGENLGPEPGDPVEDLTEAELAAPPSPPETEQVRRI